MALILLFKTETDFEYGPKIH